MRESFALISDLLFPLLQLLIIQRYMTAFLGAGKQSLVGYMGWLAYYIFLIIECFGIIFSSQFLLGGNIMLIFIICSITRRKKIKQRCIFSMLICTVWMLIEVIVIVILESAITDTKILYDAGSFLSKMCMLLLSVLIKRYMQHKHHSEISLRYFLTILLIPVSSIYLMHQIFLIVAIHEEYNGFAITTSLLLLIVNYVIFQVYDWMNRDAELQTQNLLYKQQLELCSLQAEERESLYLEIRRIRHDMKNHLSSLLGMIHAGEANVAGTYIQEMLDDGIGDRVSEVSRSGNIVIDSLINHKYALAQKDNIPFEVNVFVPVALPFQSAHLVIIFGNLLENSLEACRKLPQDKRYIRLDVTYEKGVLQISVCNSCVDNHKKNAMGKYITSKKDKVNHGMGLSSVEQAVSCYHGEIMIKDCDGKFSVTVVMYDINEEKETHLNSLKRV